MKVSANRMIMKYETDREEEERRQTTRDVQREEYIYTFIVSG